MTPSPSPARTDFAVKPVLTGEKVVLRPFTTEDAPTMIAIIGDPGVLRGTGLPRAELTTEALSAWYGSRNGTADRLDLAVTDRQTGELVGESVLYDWHPANRSCVFRILLGPHGRDRGLGTETVRLTVGHAFEQLGLNRVELGVYDFNQRARHVYESVGFAAEGVRREAMLRDGTAYDETVMSLLAREWAAHQGRPTSGP